MLVLFLSSPDFAGSAQIPDSPAARKLLSTRFFSHGLWRPHPEGPQRRPDFSLLLPALPVAVLSRGHEERRGHLSLLLGTALTLPDRSPGEHLPQEEDASTGQRSSMPVSTVVSIMPKLGLIWTSAYPAPS